MASRLLLRVSLPILRSVRAGSLPARMWQRRRAAAVALRARPQRSPSPTEGGPGGSRARQAATVWRTFNKRARRRGAFASGDAHATDAHVTDAQRSSAHNTQHAVHSTRKKWVPVPYFFCSVHQLSQSISTTRPKTKRGFSLPNRLNTYECAVPSKPSCSAPVLLRLRPAFLVIDLRKVAFEGSRGTKGPNRATNQTTTKPQVAKVGRLHRNSRPRAHQDHIVYYPQVSSDRSIIS